CSGTPSKSKASWVRSTTQPPWGVPVNDRNFAVQSAICSAARAAACAATEYFMVGGPPVFRPKNYSTSSKHKRTQGELWSRLKRSDDPAAPRALRTCSVRLGGFDGFDGYVRAPVLPQGRWVVGRFDRYKKLRCGAWGPATV